MRLQVLDFRTGTKEYSPAMQYLIRFTQLHETFRLAEIKSLAILARVDVKIISYNDEVSKKGASGRLGGFIASIPN